MASRALRPPRPAEERKPSHVQQEPQTQAHKKTSFMEKMKGRMTVLRKIEGKQKNVAEGERMKHPKDT